MRADRILALGLGAGLLSAAASASAFCRTTTCDTNDPKAKCMRDANKCETTGLPLYWPEKCLSFGVQQNGSPLRGISYQEATRVIQQAYRQWMNVTCEGRRPPSFQVWDLGEPYGGIVCDVPEFNDREPNANVWMFREDDWPYQSPGSTLALTTITFEVPTGEILDADVEVNSYRIPLSTTSDPAEVENDLLSIATHEVGHFLGLAHSLVEGATMNAAYSPGHLGFRNLETDDIKGICAIYPPERPAQECTAPRPRHGFTRYCADPASPEGCGIAAEGSAAGDTRWFAFGLGSLIFGAAARRRQRRTPGSRRASMP